MIRLTPKTTALVVINRQSGIVGRELLPSSGGDVVAAVCEKRRDRTFREPQGSADKRMIGFDEIAASGEKGRACLARRFSPR